MDVFELKCLCFTRITLRALSICRLVEMITGKLQVCTHYPLWKGKYPAGYIACFWGRKREFWVSDELTLVLYETLLNMMRARNRYVSPFPLTLHLREVELAIWWWLRVNRWNARKIMKPYMSGPSGHALSCRAATIPTLNGIPATYLFASFNNSTISLWHETCD